MRNINKNSILMVLGTFLVLGFSGTTFAATTPSLGEADSYGVLANTYTNTVAGTTINGDVGFTTGPAEAPGGVHPNYGVGAPYATAGIDQGNALNNLAAQPCTFTFDDGAIDLSTDITHGPVGVYSPGVYCSVGAMNIGGPLTLDGSGTYIFRAVGALTSTAGAVVTLAGASACDVFWTPTAATTLGANTTFSGTVISNAGITVGANTTWAGRALAFSGTVTTDTTTLSTPTCTGTINVVKAVTNDNTGISAAADFDLHVKLSGVDVAGSPAIGAVAPGTSYALAPGTYVISEDATAGYEADFSGDCDLEGNVTLAAGENLTCTITNDDIAPATLAVVKIVINDNGKTKVISDFSLFVNGAPVTSGESNVFPAPAAYTVTETMDTSYTQTFSGDCSDNGTVNLNPGDIKVCVVTNNDKVSSSSSSGGNSVPPVPPLIDVVKVPSPLALPNGPGLVTYAYALRNIGTVPVTDITMVDDSCKPITLISGDVNLDDKLDVTETWEYTCATTLTQTHTNTIVATGWANGLSIADIASATVVVGLPIVPPLIHVTKIPDVLLLPAEGGMVTYTEKVSNPGDVALSNVILTDDKCSPVNYISGDINSDSKLDPSETWTYTCQTNLTETTLNTAVATGEANGLTVRDFAIATVVVSGSGFHGSAPPAPATPVANIPNTPGFPETGRSATEKGFPWEIIILSGSLGFFLLFGKFYAKSSKL